MSDKIAVHLPTKEDCEKYIKFAQKMGWRFSSGNQPEVSLMRVRDQYEEGTCMTLGDLFYYCSFEFYKENGYRIISLEEAMREEQEQTNVQEMHNAPEFVRGEEVEVSSYEGSDRYPAKYYDTIEGETYPYIAKALTGIQYHTWEYIRKLPQVQEGTKKFTREEIKMWVERNYIGYDIKSLAGCIVKYFEQHGMLEE